MKKNYLLTIIALLVMQLSSGQSENYQDAPSDNKEPARFEVEATLNPPEDQQSEIEGFKMYPNPVTNGFVTITTKRNLSKRIRIIDVLGNVVINTELNAKTLNVSGLVPGIYIMKVAEEKQSTTRKLVIR